ncbi:hypothetical protein LSH36_17g07011 [Paralvinella palmiformis]|uniref:MYND-type domain-containing protein n=1 Tax=Paralvinella palmiformis TaxID=53620 RepID=A0AAD9NIH6_9ANNE|nr:hypothetical protein LSH36_17g07011 [Paralvinella palmiformis]
MSASTMSGVELGFVEAIDEKWKLLSHYFPSKVGGRPAWLVLNPLPTADDIRCGICGKPCTFLLQIYAPLDEHERCFHRTIFLFVCRDPHCSKANDSRNVKAFRCQLGKINDFYSSEPPDESCFDSTVSHPKADDHQPLCRVCGCSGPKTCARCHRAAYCSKEHQTLDWKTGHKRVCSADPEGGNSTSSSYSVTYLFPEYELVMEEEVELGGEEPEKSEAEKMREYKEYLTAFQEKGSLLADEDASNDLDKMATATDIDREFRKFKKRVNLEPNQVLRYQRGCEPLWVSADHIPSADDLPKCSCGGERKFEFQVMPQLLYHLKVDDVGASLDWGVLAVYTCSESCQPHNDGYQQEFVWKQDFSTDTKKT